MTIVTLLELKRTLPIKEMLTRSCRCVCFDVGGGLRGFNLLMRSLLLWEAECVIHANKLLTQCHWFRDVKGEALLWGSKDEGGALHIFLISIFKEEEEGATKTVGSKVVDLSLQNMWLTLNLLSALHSLLSQGFLIGLKNQRRDSEKLTSVVMYLRKLSRSAGCLFLITSYPTVSTLTFPV